MDAVEYIRHQVASTRRLVDGALRGTTDAQLAWAPPGTANPVAATLVHILATEDQYIQTVLQNRPRLWETEGWGTRLGLDTPPGGGQGWPGSRQAKLALEPLLAYEQAVRSATDVYLTNLTSAELDRSVLFIRGQQPVAAVLATLIVHTAGHAGEITAVRGLQGVTGLPF